MVADREMIVQRLASTATDKSMKYERIGPQEFVKYDYEELTIKQNLKDACYKHFKDRLLGLHGVRYISVQEWPIMFEVFIP